MKLSLKTAPAEEPVTLAEAKIQLHMDSDVTTEDALVTSIIVAARQYVESFTGRALVTQTWYAYLDEFPCDDFVELPFGELQSVTSVKTKDYQGDETTLTVTTQYLVDSESEPGRIVLPYSVSWPSLDPYPFNPITIEFICGYGGASAVPDSLKHAIKLMVGDLYKNRETRLDKQQYDNDAAVNLMYPYRLWNVY